MSLIEKIDKLSTTITDSETMDELISKKAVKVILSMQKEPCIPTCNQCEFEFTKQCDVNCKADAMRWKFKSKRLTIGDKIRESNESLAEFASKYRDDTCNNGCDGNCDNHKDCYVALLDYLNRKAD